MKPAKIYPVVIPAGGSFVLLAQGDFFKIISATSGVEVTGDTWGTVGQVLAGQGMENQPFNRLIFRDLSGAGSVLSVLIAGESFVDDRITGEVSVIDGEKARTIAGGMFSGSAYSAAAPALCGYGQLWNPALSGKNIIVAAVSVSTDVAGCAVNFNFGVLPAATDQSATRLRNKKLGAAVGLGQIRAETRAAAPASTMWGGFVGAAQFLSWPIKGAIVIPPGYGLEVGMGTVNVGLTANFEWFEEFV